jgi:hypothetical protein
MSPQPPAEESTAHAQWQQDGRLLVVQGKHCEPPLLAPAVAVTLEVAPPAPAVAVTLEAAPPAPLSTTVHAPHPCAAIRTTDTNDTFLINLPRISSSASR